VVGGECQARAGVNGSLPVSGALLGLTGFIPQNRGRGGGCSNSEEDHKIGLEFRGTRE
jgi:hypothetical protein